MKISKRIGIDLGTANSVVYLQGKGIVLNEPTVVAVTVDDNKVVAVGSEAKEMLGRTPGTIMASKPMREGVIADYVVTEAILRYFINKVCGRSFWFRPEVMVCVPAGCTQVEKRAVEDATLAAGARVVSTIQESFAAALGAGINVGEASGNMIIDMGGGSSEAAVISLGGVVVSDSIRLSGNALDDAIAQYLRKKQGIIIGEQTAEEIKLKIGRAMKMKRSDPEESESDLKEDLKGEKPFEVKGRDSIQGLPKMVLITAEEVEAAIKPKINQMISMIKGVLEKIPPELASDIIDKGVVLAGGTALLRNLDQLLTQELNVPCHVADEPMLCVAKGTGIALDNLDLYKRAISRR